MTDAERDEIENRLLRELDALLREAEARVMRLRASLEARRLARERERPS